MDRKLFQIGFNRCGTTFVARLFAMNGYPAVHWEEGALAEDIVWSRLAGIRPLQRWADRTVAFTDMESVRYLNMPIVEGFREFAFLDQSYPGSVFLLNTRRLDDWIASRYRHRGGSYAHACAQIRGVAVADLADLWAADWTAHLAACRTHFAGRAEFVEIDIDQAAPGDYRDALAPWFDLPHCPPRPAAAAPRRTAPPRDQPAGQAAGGHLDRAIVTGACPPAILAGDGGPDVQALLDLDRGEVRDGSGTLLPLRPGPGGFFHLGRATHRLLRIATTVNDIAQAADHGVYRIDMRPGHAGGAGRPVLAACRRVGAANVFLWPMPWMHRLGNDGHLGRPGRPDAPFDRKRDRAVFRGGLSGHVAGADGRSRPVHQVVADLLAGRSDAHDDLRRATRVAVALGHHRSPDVDAGLTPDPQGAQALHRAGLSHLIDTRMEEEDLLDHRYLICLGATSGAEDFLPMANSRAVVLLEEDGWDCFGRALFRPWRHYIPLRAGAGDLSERLAWARANPDACQGISARARAICAALADPRARRDQLAAILRAYRAATGQTARS